MSRVFPKLFSLLILLSAFVDSCPAFAALKAIHHGTYGSLVFDTSGDLVLAANDTAITRFAYDDDHRVTRAETLVGSAVFDVAF